MNQQGDAHPVVTVEVGQASTRQWFEEMVHLGARHWGVPTIPQTHHALGLGVVIQGELQRQEAAVEGSQRTHDGARLMQAHNPNKWLQ